jgi:hypothetical protein
LLNSALHRKAYIFFISCLAAAISLGKVPMSISLIGMTLNFLLEGRFTRKWGIIKKRKYLPIIFSGLFLVELLWLPFCDDMFLGLNALRIKLPLLLLPLIIGASAAITKKELKTIVSIFFIGLLVSTIWVYLVSIDLLPTKKNSGTIRDASIFMSHIRYSVLLSFSLIFLCYLSYKTKINKALAYLMGLWLFFLIFKLATLTAILALFVAIIVSFFYLLKKNNKQIITSVALLLLATIFYNAYIIRDFYHLKKEERSISEKSISGEKYWSDLSDNTTENGYYLFENIAIHELEKEWQKRSEIKFKGFDKKGQKIKATLYRFLTSKGLNKDSLGLSKLSSKEISLVEQGETTVISYNNYEKRVRALLYERKINKKSNNPNNQTINQRLEFWKLGQKIYLEKSVLGHGPGGIKSAFKNYYNSNPTLLKKENRLLAHNQFITQAVNLGGLGFCLWLAILVLSFLKVKKEIIPLFISYAILMFFAFISDDMLEVQAGVTIFSFFGALLLFYESKDLESL